MVSASSLHPMVRRTLLRTRTTIRSDFALHGRPRGRHAKPTHVLNSPLQPAFSDAVLKATWQEMTLALIGGAGYLPGNQNR
ncbi:hypothetical protein [Streptomyces sp. NPDC048581]|uniref:hypothetical protein n=1 Tax=unclassified Streptomyces TaxID=2593676 RepID=UPI00371DA69C